LVPYLGKGEDVSPVGRGQALSDLDEEVRIHGDSHRFLEAVASMQRLRRCRRTPGVLLA